MIVRVLGVVVGVVVSVNVFVRVQVALVLEASTINPFVSQLPL